MVPEELQKTIPDLLRTYADARGEVLVVSALPGCTAWQELHASLLPSRRLGAHFEHAGRWLAAFHEATRHDDETTAVHGDFWAHNILHDGNDHVAVIDWENFTPEGSRYTDLFHYPLTMPPRRAPPTRECCTCHGRASSPCSTQRGKRSFERISREPPLTLTLSPEGRGD